VDSFEADIAMPCVGDAPFRAVFIRAPRVDVVGDGVSVLATIDTQDGESTIVAVRQGPLMATAFHPELTGDHRVHEHFVEIVRQHA
jgi:5'-phosphate synthase pdxT subunit